MLREGLRREIPEVFEWASLHRPRIAREPLVWATLSAIGAALLVDFALLALFSALGRVVDLRLPILPFQLREILATAAAVAVALRAGGPSALGLYLAYLALGLLIGLPGTLHFCERSGGHFDFCSVEGFVLVRWPDLVALPVGLLATRALGTRAGANAVFSAAGTYTVMALPAMFAFSLMQDPPPDQPIYALAIAAIVSVVAGVIAGLVLRLRGGLLWQAALIAVLIALAWLVPNVPLFDPTAYGMPAEERSLAIVAGLAGPVAILATASLSAARARSRRPGAGAARRAPR